MRPRIAVDLDGVLANTMIPFCRILNQRHESQYKPDSFVDWKAWDIAHIDKNEFFRTLDEAWFSWQEIPPVEENIGAKVEQLRKYGRFDIVTGRSEETVPNAKLWLKQHAVRYDAFVKTVGTSAKATLGYDVFIDDSPELMVLVGSSSDKYGILYTQPWNRNADKMPRVSRADHWSDIPSLLEQSFAST